ncbi:MAG: lysozyme inhibitor LprI family protein [Alphaproteobacteria bacterium]
MKLLTLFAVWTALVIAPLESKGQEPDPDWKPPGAEEQAAVDQANERLGAIYKRLMHELEGYPLNDLGQKALKEAERSWIKWRDDEAMLIARVGGAEGGSGLRIDFAEAQLKLINQRIEVLNEYLKRIAEDQSAND